MKFKTISVLLLKGTKILKLAKSLKFIKVFISAISMAVFAATYSVSMGIALGCGITLLLFAHEIGHVLALVEKGFGLKAPIFIPFVGAAVFLPPEALDDRDTEAYVGFGGPLLGTAGAIAASMPYLLTAHPFWLSLSFFGVMINLFNMIPVRPFDGGRIIQAADYRMRYLGLALLVFFTIRTGDAGFLIFWMFVISDFDKWKSKSRCQAITLICAAMLYFFWVSSETKFWEKILNSSLGIFFMAMYWLGHWFKHVYDKKPDIANNPDTMDQRPELDKRARLSWLSLWLCLGLIQALVLYEISKLMKK